MGGGIAWAAADGSGTQPFVAVFGASIALRFVAAWAFHALVREVRDAAETMGSEPLLARADQLAQLARGRGAELEPWHPLTVREFEVAQRIAEGKTNAEIGQELFISPKTASSHVEHILGKLGVTRRAEIAAWVTTVATLSMGR